MSFYWGEEILVSFFLLLYMAVNAELRRARWWLVCRAIRQ